MLRIDSHQHFWQLSRGDYGWLTPALSALYQDFLPADLLPAIMAAGIDKTIVVQAAPSVAETKYLLRLAGTTDFIAGVVGWADLANANINDELRALCASPYFLGIRPMIQDMPDPNWMLQPALQPGFHSVTRLGLTFDALIKPQHIAILQTLMQRHPDLKVVIDHGAKPNIAKGEYQHWSQQIKHIAATTRACCKLSGLVTEAGDKPGYQRLWPYVDHLLQCFGPARLMWGSDWPVVNMASSYAEWAALTDELLAPLDEADRSKILGGTAQAFYRLSDNTGNKAIAV